MNHITPEQWTRYDDLGYINFGTLLDEHELAALRQRIDDIMLGRADLDYSRVMMQLDTDTGKYEDMPRQTRGHKGATLGYRKIQDLEFDPLFRAYVERPLFKEICQRVLGCTPPM